MKGCLNPLATGLFSGLIWVLLGGALISYGNPAAAQQVQRVFPAAALRGVMTFLSADRVLVDGHEEHLGPGVRVRNRRNMTVFASSLQGQHFIVNYLRDASGHIDEVWILNATELEHDRRASAKWAHAYDPSLYAN